MSLRPHRLLPGADLRTAVAQLASRPDGGAEGAFVVAGIGSLARAQLRFAGEPVATLIDGPLEIISLSGSTTADGAHLHMAVSDAAGRAWGGHVAAGCEVRTTVELLIAEAADWTMRRRWDAATGYPELSVERKPAE